MASTISRDIDTGMSCLLVETVVRGYHLYKVLWEPRVGDQHVKYFGFPLPELEIIYPICAKGCRKIRDAEIYSISELHMRDNFTATTHCGISKRLYGLLWNHTVSC